MIHDTGPIAGAVTRRPANSPNEPSDPRSWVRVLADYREPSHPRSVIELIITLVPFIALWALAWGSLSVSYPLAAALAILNSAFLVRLS